MLVIPTRARCPSFDLPAIRVDTRQPPSCTRSADEGSPDPEFFTCFTPLPTSTSAVGRWTREAIRTIEESNPDLSFDWAKMLKLRAAAAAQPAEPGAWPPAVGDTQGAPGAQEAIGARRQASSPWEARSGGGLDRLGR